MGIWSSGVTVVALFCLILVAHAQENPVEVDISSGKIRGFESTFLGSQVRSFLGVPFAEPPIGENRFKPPVPKSAWTDTLDATKPSPACYQPRDDFHVGFWGTEMWNANTENSEDCLYSNIWAPANANNLPVMIWVYGGGFFYGSPSLILYDGKALALTGNVVVVNINYRVGPFGFLYLGNEGAPGNMGLLDQQMAIKWVRDNIANFGGDPSKITLFGESAGAASIVAQMIAPDSQGLFKNVILQSGTLTNKWAMNSPARALEKSQDLVKRSKCEKDAVSETVECLRALTSEQVIDAEMWNIVTFMEFPFVPVSKDPNFFKEKDGFVALQTGDYDKTVNILAGFNRDEGNFWAIYNFVDDFYKPEKPELTWKRFIKDIGKAFPPHASKLHTETTFTYSDGQCKTPGGLEKSTCYAEELNQVIGDYFFTCDLLWLTDQMKNGPGQVYVYYFTQPSSANPWPKWTGVMHGYEIEFVFGVPIHNETAGYTQAEKDFSEKVVKYWSSFATNGVPSAGNGGTTWPNYAKTGKWMKLESGQIEPMDKIKQKQCALWDGVKKQEYEEYLKSSSA